MFNTLFTNFWTDLHDTKVWWEIGAVTVCVVASYLVSMFLRRRFPVDVSPTEPDKVSSKLFTNMLFPMVMAACLYIAKYTLSGWHHVYLISLLIPIFNALALTRFGLYLSRRIFATGSQIAGVHLFIERVFFWGVWLVAVLYYSGPLKDIMHFMDSNYISIGRNNLSVTEILQAIISVCVTVVFALWASAALDKRLMKVHSIHSSSRMVLSRVGRTLLIICAILISLNLVGIDPTVLSIFSGALGVGLGLGLQKIASSYVAGFIILFDRSLTINDMITVDKYSGKVSEINTRYTVLKGLDGVEAIIPNEMLVSQPVQNLSFTDTDVWMSTDVTVAYNTDIEALLPMLINVVDNVTRVTHKSSPSANLVNFGANGLELRIGFWISDPENGRMSVISQVNREIWKLLKRLNVEVPYPQTEIRVLDRN